MCIFANCICLACIVVSYVYLLYLVCFCCTMYVLLFLLLDAGLLAGSQYQEGPATGHLDTGFPWFPCVYKRMLRWFPSFQVATTCLSCSPPNFPTHIQCIQLVSPKLVWGDGEKNTYMRTESYWPTTFMVIFQIIVFIKFHTLLVSLIPQVLWYSSFSSYTYQVKSDGR